MSAEEITAGAIVRALVRSIPAGRVASYGTIGRVAAALGRPIGGARTVAWILASLKALDDTPWHRVVGARGVILLPDRRGALQVSRLRLEGVRFSRGLVLPNLLLDEAELRALARPSSLGRRRPGQNVELLLAQKRIRFNSHRLRQQTGDRR